MIDPVPDAPVPDFTACPHWGQGGRYVVDPVTGQRTLLAPDEQFSPGLGEIMTPVEGETLTAPETTTKKGR